MNILNCRRWVGCVALCFVAVLLVDTSRGDFLVTSRDSHSVMRFDESTGSFVSEFIPAFSGGLIAPVGLRFGPDDNLYVSSAGSDQVLRYNGTSGAFIDVFATLPADSQPADLRFGPDGNLYVARFGGDTVQRYDGTTGAFIDDFTGANLVYNSTNLRFGPDGNLYVGSFGTDQVLRYNGATGAFIDVFAEDVGNLSGPSGMVFDASGDLLVASINTGKVLRFDGATGAADGEFLALNSFFFPSAAEYGPNGDYYLTSLAFNTVERFSPAGVPISTVASGNGLMLPAGIEFIIVDTPGDANGDGKVDGLDYLVWAGSFGDDPAADPPGSPANGDFDDNGVVDGLDYLVWAGNFGNGPNDAAAVPEPTTLALAGVGGMLLVLRRRRGR
jgi:hypothetical protein